jgi:autotransporter-associated beta strand protein
MKSELRNLRSVILLYSALATTAVFGQTIYIWTNQNPLNNIAGDLAQATNWSPNGVPIPNTGPNGSGGYGDEMQFDGQTTGPLTVTQNASQAGGAGSGFPYGLRIHLTSNQTTSVTIFSPVMVSAGMRMNYFSIDAGAGSLNLGDHGTNCLDVLAGVLNGQILGFTNNSSTPCVINESVRWRLGGAGVHPFVFNGTGDWVVNNRLRSVTSGSITVQKFGPGTMTWTATNAANALASDPLGTPITIGGGTMIWKSSDIVGGTAGKPNIVHNGTLFEYDAPLGSGLIAGNISGTGRIQMNAGTLTLSGANTFTGNITLSGGTLIAGSTETTGVSGPLGRGGVISFTGGTLGFSTNNAFDYSPRFFQGPISQNYSFDVPLGVSVLFTNNLGSYPGSLTKLGAGRLTLGGGSLYDGMTTISNGMLVFEGSKSGSGPITVADGATLGVFCTVMPFTPLILTIGTSSDAAVEFDNVTSTTTPAIQTYTLSCAGTVTIGINSGTFAPGQSYPLLSWINGSAPVVGLRPPNGFDGNLSFSGNTLLLNVTAVSAPTLNFAQAGNSLQLSWDKGFGNFKLQAETNSVDAGLSDNWADYPGGGTTPVTVPTSATNGTVFFRLISTP